MGYDEQDIIAIANICWDATNAFRKSIGQAEDITAWDDLPPAKKESLCKGVLDHLSDPLMTPVRSHELWCKEPCNAGKFQSTLAFADLPITEQIKAFLFSGICSAFRLYAYQYLLKENKTNAS